MAAILNLGLFLVLGMASDFRFGFYDQNYLIIDIFHGIFPTHFFFYSERAILAAVLNLGLILIPGVAFDVRFGFHD